MVIKDNIKIIPHIDSKQAKDLIISTYKKEKLLYFCIISLCLFFIFIGLKLNDGSAFFDILGIIGLIVVVVFYLFVFCPLDNVSPYLKKIAICEDIEALVHVNEELNTLKYTYLILYLQLKDKLIIQLNTDSNTILYLNKENTIEVFKLKKPLNVLFKIEKSEDVLEGCVLDFNSKTLTVPFD